VDRSVWIVAIMASFRALIVGSTGSVGRVRQGVAWILSFWGRLFVCIHLVSLKAIWSLSFPCCSLNMFILSGINRYFSIFNVLKFKMYKS
jgi:hypothetical protein